MFCVARAASGVKAAATAGSTRGASATGSVYMKPSGGAAMISQVCSAGLNM
jgi:hypothetical protein